MKLFWNDVNGNSYFIGTLSKDEDYFSFELNNNGLKEAMRHGCFGIGNIDISKESHKSKELFHFFKNRIPRKDAIDIDRILEQYDMKEYDEMELLEKTQGRLITDRYYLE